MCHFLLRTIVMTALLFGLTVSSWADDWTQFRGPKGSGVSAEKELPAEPTLIWKTPLVGDGCSSPIVSDGRVYVTTAYPGDEGNDWDDAGATATLILAAIAGGLTFLLGGGMIVRFVFSRRWLLGVYTIFIVALTTLVLAKPAWVWQFSDPWTGTLLAAAELWWVETFYLRPVIVFVTGFSLVIFTRLTVQTGSSDTVVWTWMQFTAVVASLACAVVSALIAWQPEWFFLPGQPWLAWIVTGGVALFTLGASVGWLGENRWPRLLLSVAGLTTACWMFASAPTDQFTAKLDWTIALAIVAPGCAFLLCQGLLCFLAWRCSPPSRPCNVARTFTCVTLAALACLLFVRSNYLRSEVGLVRAVICLDARNGDIMWTTPVFAAPAEKSHSFNSHATPTCAADGTRVYVYFGSGVAALDQDGRVLWVHRDIDYHRYARYGTGSSLVLADDMLIVYRDSEFAGHGDHLDDDAASQSGRRASLLIAFDKHTGVERWRVSPKFSHDSYMTPLVWTRAGRLEIVIATWKTLAGIDAATGAVNWTHAYPMQQIVPSLAVHGDLLFASGGNVLPCPLHAIRAPSNEKSSATIWSSKKQGGSMASPLCLNDNVYTITHAGVLTCLFADTGKLKWNRRVSSKFLGSPVAGDGKLYLVDQMGTMSVVAADSGKLLCELSLDEACAATPAIANGHIFVRTARHVWCFGSDSRN